MTFRTLRSHASAVAAVLLLAAAVMALGMLALTPSPAEAQTRFSIRAVHLRPGNVTASKLALSTIAATVTTGNPSVTTAANAPTVGGTVIGVVPTGNQDQFIDNVVVNANGGVTVTLAANATANNTFNVLVMRVNP